MLLLKGVISQIRRFEKVGLSGAILMQEATKSTLIRYGKSKER
jgi:hypothetical protein